MLEAHQRISVTMAAEHWNQVITVLAEAPMPHRVTDPLIREIHQQCMAAAQPAGPEPHQATAANNITQLHEQAAGC